MISVIIIQVWLYLLCKLYYC